MKRHRPSPAMTVAIVAVILALAGTGYAGVKLGRNSVGTFQIKNGAVTNTKLRDRAVSAEKLSPEVLGCPGGTIAIGPGCIETAARTPHGFSEAAAICGSLARRLALASELVAAKARGVALASPELVGDVRVNEGRFGQVVLQSDARAANSEPIDTARRFRCIAAPGDG